jgi:hypothetical protein
MPAAAPRMADSPAALAAAGARVDRIASASAHDTLDRIQNSALLETGAVNIVGLDAIRRQLGDRWPAKRARVWEHVELELGRKLGPADVAVRVDEINYLIATPGRPGFAAQALCLSVLKDVLKFFLGEIKTGDVAVRTVTELTVGAVVSAPVDLSKLAAAAEAAATMDSAAAPAAEAAAPARLEPGDTLAEPRIPFKEWRPPLTGRSSVVELAPPKQPPFDLTLSVQPVWNLKRGLITSFVIDRQGAPEKAEPAAFAEIDVATFAYAATLLEEHASQGGPLTLHAPVSFSSLAVQHTRVRLMKLTESVREAMRVCLLLEICGLDAGVPPSRLIEVVGLVRSLCAGIVGRVRPSRQALAAVKGCGLRGLVIEAPLLGLSQGDGPARMKAFVGAAQGVSPNLIVHGLPAMSTIDEAAAAGFTHASVAASPAAAQVAQAAPPG